MMLPVDAQRDKESPGRAGALGPNEGTSSFLDAPILSQGTNQAGRGLGQLGGRVVLHTLTPPA